MLAAFALVLSYIETFIPLPIPIPGAKLGLANIAILLALEVEGAKSAAAIAAIKTLAMGLIFGSPLMIPYSAAGTFLALLVMGVLMHVRGLHIILISVVGALFHVVGQLAVAALMLGTLLVWATFPFLYVIACVTGALTGWVAAKLVRALASANKADLPPVDAARMSNPLHASTTGSEAFMDPRIPLVLFVGYLVLVLGASSLLVLGAYLLIALAFAVRARVTPKEALMALMPLLSILVVTTVAQVLYQTDGQPIFWVGPVAVTDEALRTVALMFLRLACIMTMSVAFMKLVPLAQMTDALMRMLRPLHRLNIHAEALILAFNLALQFVPVLCDEFRILRQAALGADPSFAKGGVVKKLRAYAELLTPLALTSFAYADNVADRFACAVESADAQVAEA